MQMAGMAPKSSYDEIPHGLAPLLDPKFYWVSNRVTPFELVEKPKDCLNVKLGASPNA